MQQGHAVRLKSDHSKVNTIEYLGDEYAAALVGVPGLVELNLYESCLVNGLGVGDFAYCWKTKQVVKILGFLYTGHENVRVTSNCRVFEVYGWALLPLSDSLTELKLQASEAVQTIERIQAFLRGSISNPL